MVKMVAPMYSVLAPDVIKNYSPSEDKIFMWHIVKRAHAESLASIAKEYRLPVARLIEFNFPGSVKAGRVNPDIVNWYLFYHVRTHCRRLTRDGHNYMFKGGEKVAIPHIGHVELGEPTFFVPTNTQFKIRQLANLNVSKIVAADFSIFQIWDQKAGTCSFYTYWAGGLSASLTPGWLSATSEGPWNDMVVTKAVAVNQFSGAARFTTGGAGSRTLNYITFISLPPETVTVPSPVPLQTGFTLGIGGGTSVGDLKLELVGTANGVLPFKGP